MPDFKLDSVFTPTADQPKAIAALAEGVEGGERFQTLLGATGTGKTMAMAGVIEAVQRPTLVIAHNKTLAAQLCNEFRTFFPENAVEYFVSYYDYYQPEAYVPSRDLYIEKDSAINQEVERLQQFDPLTGELIADDLEHVAIWPATHYNVKEGTIEAGVAEIGRELNERCEQLESEGKQLESHRLRQRTQYDMEMLREVGFCSGIENYSRILDGRKPGDRPYCLIDYFPKDFVCFCDESHQTVPQIGGMV